VSTVSYLLRHFLLGSMAQCLVGVLGLLLYGHVWYVFADGATPSILGERG
jgi:hypothetical protein